MHCLVKSLMFGLVLIGLSACDAPETKEAPITETSYNAALAQELGADEYGMRNYMFVVLKTGPNDATLTDPEARQKVFAGHFSNMATLAEAGHLVLAGPFMEGGDKGDKRGLYIFDTDDLATAEAWVKTDPAVEAGVFVYEITPYFGSAALKKVNDIHTTIQKKKM